MADIDIERKSPAVWPWILGLLALLLLGWLLYEMFDDDDDVPVDQEVSVVAADTAGMQTAATQPGATPAAPAAAAPTAEVEAYTTACAGPEAAREEMALDHAFTSDCIRRLTAALTSVVQRDTVNGAALGQQMDAYRQRATALEQSDPQSTQHANLTRDVFVSAADLMARVQETRPVPAAGLGERVAEVRQAAAAVRDGTPLLEQRQEVGRFFRSAAEALRLMAQPSV